MNILFVFKEVRSPSFHELKICLCKTFFDIYIFVKRYEIGFKLLQNYRFFCSALSKTLYSSITNSSRWIYNAGELRKPVYFWLLLKKIQKTVNDDQTNITKYQDNLYKNVFKEASMILIHEKRWIALINIHYNYSTIVVWIKANF